MLTVFTVSLTPKQYLHDAFTHRHTDKLYDVSHSKEKKITNHQYNCGFINIEATSPFVVSSLNVNPNKTRFECAFIEKLPDPYKSPTTVYTALRGPPAA